MNTLFKNKTLPLYAICDEQTCQHYKINSTMFYQSLVQAGVQIIQYRNKIDSPKKIYEKIKELKNNTPANVSLVVNDFFDIAQELQLPVHLGQEDKKLSENFAYGKGISTHNAQEIETAKKNNADYIGFGAAFASPTKPNVQCADSKTAVELWQKPIIFIGGITLENVFLLPKEKNIYYAVISDLFRYGKSSENIARYVKEFESILK